MVPVRTPPPAASAVHVVRTCTPAAPTPMHPDPAATGQATVGFLATGASGVGRDASTATPAAVRAAPLRKAAGMPLAATTRPRRTGPPLNPRSMKMLAVPAALPRSDGGTWLKKAANTPGGRKAGATGSTAAPANKHPPARTTAEITKTTTEAPRAAAAPP